MTSVEIDLPDRQILDLLGNDARLSNRSIGRRLGLAEGTVRTRIRRLQARGLLRFTAITDSRQHGNLEMAFIRVLADTLNLQELAMQIGQIPDVHGVMITLGRFNLLVVGLFPSSERLSEVANRQLFMLPQIRKVEVSSVVKSLKYNERMARLKTG
jgi:Lrp/AsnC family transcriptional regulator for asnA, asnC and gidA